MGCKVANGMDCPFGSSGLPCTGENRYASMICSYPTSTGRLTKDSVSLWVVSPLLRWEVLFLDRTTLHSHMVFIRSLPPISHERSSTAEQMLQLPGIERIRALPAQSVTTRQNALPRLVLAWRRVEKAPREKAAEVPPAPF